MTTPLRPRLADIDLAVLEQLVAAPVKRGRQTDR
jgi:hypothetical protein